MPLAHGIQLPPTLVESLRSECQQLAQQKFREYKTQVLENAKQQLDRLPDDIEAELTLIANGLAEVESREIALGEIKTFIASLKASMIGDGDGTLCLEGFKLRLTRLSCRFIRCLYTPEGTRKQSVEIRPLADTDVRDWHEGSDQ